MENSDFSDRQQAMNRHRRRIAHARSEDEHRRISKGLQVVAMEAIQGDPVAYQAFLARNHHRRRHDDVQRLLRDLLRAEA